MQEQKASKDDKVEDFKESPAVDEDPRLTTPSEEASASWTAPTTELSTRVGLPPLPEWVGASRISI